LLGNSQRNHFAVLEGPPEVGKTAIAWMITLAQISQGWEGISCGQAGRFFERYVYDRRQIFVADDAFGRTEYHVTSGQEWEKYLGRILSRLDHQHWLIWTSRKNILEKSQASVGFTRACNEIPIPRRLYWWMQVI